MKGFLLPKTLSHQNLGKILRNLFGPPFFLVFSSQPLIEPMSRERTNTLFGVLFGGSDGHRHFKALAARPDVQAFLGARLGDTASSEDLLVRFVNMVKL